MDIIKTAKELNVSPDDIKMALRLSFEEVFEKIYKIPQPMFNIDTLTMDIFYRVGKDIPLEAAQIISERAFNGGVIFQDLPIREFPPDFMRMVKRIFKEKLFYADEITKRERWLKKLHTIIDGRIISVEKDKIFIQAGYELAIMPKDAWVIKEKEKYRPDHILKFYVSKIESIPFQIYLSRYAEKLPEQLMKQTFPFSDFKTIKRCRGKISFIHSDIRINENVKKKLAELEENHLNGENIVILKPGKILKNHGIYKANKKKKKFK